MDCLKAAFDSINWEAPWLLLLSLGLPWKLVNLFKALYSDTLSCFCTDRCDSDSFFIGMVVVCVKALWQPQIYSSHLWTGCSVIQITCFFCVQPQAPSHSLTLILPTIISDIARLTEVVSILVLALKIISREVKSLSLKVNWMKTKIQTSDTFFPGSLVLQWHAVV